MWILVVLALLVQTQPPALLVGTRGILRQLSDQLDAHRPTFGATADLTTAKHQLRSWIESRLAGQGHLLDADAFANTLRSELRDAGMLCDDCGASVNYLGFVDDVRVNRQGDLLVVVTAIGISCGYDESAYAYGWSGQEWKRVWEHEQNIYTPEGYLPQQIHDIQMSSPDTRGTRMLMLLGSQTVCGGAFKNLYARAWQVSAGNELMQVLNWTGYGNDGYPPLTGRVLPDDLLFEYTAGGFISGEGHTAVRHFRFEQNRLVQVDPIAGRPLDFVLEWLATAWEESRARSAPTSLQSFHAELRRDDAAGDFPGPTLRCTSGPDLWQVETNLYERPKRYYRVRWQSPFTFTMVDISPMPFPDCTAPDDRSDSYPNLLGSNPH